MRGTESPFPPLSYLFSFLFLNFSDLYLWFSHSIATQLGSAMRPWGQKSYGACSPRCVIGKGGGLAWAGQWVKGPWKTQVT